MYEEAPIIVQYLGRPMVICQDTNMAHTTGTMALERTEVSNVSEGLLVEFVVSHRVRRRLDPSIQIRWTKIILMQALRVPRVPRTRLLGAL